MPLNKVFLRSQNSTKTLLLKHDYRRQGFKFGRGQRHGLPKAPFLGPRPVSRGFFLCICAGFFPEGCQGFPGWAKSSMFLTVFLGILNRTLREGQGCLQDSGLSFPRPPDL